MDLIDKHIIKRSTRAIKCLSFNSAFYDEIKNSGLSAETVFQMKARYLSDVFFNLSNSQEIENNFLWLIKIGVLRREVDGQGLTSKVRLTPIGRVILSKNPSLPNQNPSFLELTANWMFRKLSIN